MKNDYYFIYETTNLINGMKYRGMHKTKNINDNYLGSGVIVRKSIKKYGKENFKREILEFCDSYDDLIELEKKYVNNEWVKNRDNYNAKTGGQSSGILSSESKNKISETLKKKYQNGELTSNIGNWMIENGHLRKGIKMNEEIKKKCSISGKKRFEENKENHPLVLFHNKIITDETKDKISKSLKERYKTKIHPSTGKTHNGNKNQIPWNKGLKGVQKSCNKGIPRDKYECPHCGKFVDVGNGNRWHFDNCKNKPI